jgi:hypothetical protein
MLTPLVIATIPLKGKGLPIAVSSPSDGSAIWADIVRVNGTKPTSGSIRRGCKVRRLMFAGNNVFAPGTSWSNPGFLKETASWDSYEFPAGYPAAAAQ